jgi:hypothetical protein
MASGPWDTVNVGGEEVDIDWLLDGPQAVPPTLPNPAGVNPNAVTNADGLSRVGKPHGALGDIAR